MYRTLASRARIPCPCSGDSWQPRDAAGHLSPGERPVLCVAGFM